MSTSTPQLRHTPNSGPLRVAIDARIPDGQWGGVQQVVMGIAKGLSLLGGGDEYVFLGRQDTDRWLRPFLAGPCRLEFVPPRLGQTMRRRAYQRVSNLSPWLAESARRAAAALGRLSVPVPRSDGWIESLGFDLIHFTTQQAFITGLPSIYQPHDLQHIHLPELFNPLQVRYRDRTYRAFCNQATLVTVMTEWGRRDLCRAFGLSPALVAVVPWAPVAGLELPGPSGKQTSRPPGILERYILYPAQTWPHKNHIALLEALALLRDRGLVVPLVCTGRLNEHFDEIRRRVEQLGLEAQVQFLGYVTTGELEAAFRSATAVVFPSRFEGWGLPVIEAFALGVPVACSNATVLPEVAGDAALMFDPDDVEDMAAAIGRIWGDVELRRLLAARGTERVSTLSWERTARTFRALYRSVAGRLLSDEDRALLAPPTLVS